MRIGVFVGDWELHYYGDRIALQDDVAWEITLSSSSISKFLGSEEAAGVHYSRQSQADDDVRQAVLIEGTVTRIRALGHQFVDVDGVVGNVTGTTVGRNLEYAPPIDGESETRDLFVERRPELWSVIGYAIELEVSESSTLPRESYEWA